MGQVVRDRRWQLKQAVACSSVSASAALLVGMAITRWRGGADWRLAVLVSLAIVTTAVTVALMLRSSVQQEGAGALLVRNPLGSYAIPANRVRAVSKRRTWTADYYPQVVVAEPGKAARTVTVCALPFASLNDPRIQDQVPVLTQALTS